VGKKPKRKLFFFFASHPGGRKSVRRQLRLIAYQKTTGNPVNEIQIGEQ